MLNKCIATTSAVLAALAAFSPVLAQDQTGTANPASCIENFDPQTDYFEHKVSPSHSTLWEIEYHNSYKVLTVPNSEYPDRPGLQYLLVQCGAPMPELTGGLEDAIVVEIPVDRTIVTHRNGLGMLDEIGAVETIVGASHNMFGYAEQDAWYRSMLDLAGDPLDIGSEGGVEFEATVALEPDIIVMDGYGAGYEQVGNVLSRGLPAVMVSNRIEPTPLASAEWIKFLSAFYNVEETANETFSEIEAGYDETINLVADALPDGYTVYTCIDPNGGCAFMYAHGASTLNGQIIERLGAENPFAEGNNALNGMAFDYEASLARASNADFFILYSWVSETLANDERYQNFDAIARGDFIQANDHNLNECYATSYVRVDMLIRDFALGLLPDLFPGEEGVCFSAPQTIN